MTRLLRKVPLKLRATGRRKGARPSAASVQRARSHTPARWPSVAQDRAAITDDMMLKEEA